MKHLNDMGRNQSAMVKAESDDHMVRMVMDDRVPANGSPGNRYADIGTESDLPSIHASQMHSPQ